MSDGWIVFLIMAGGCAVALFLGRLANESSTARRRAPRPSSAVAARGSDWSDTGTTDSGPAPWSIPTAGTGHDPGRTEDAPGVGEDRSCSAEGDSGGLDGGHSGGFGGGECRTDSGGGGSDWGGSGSSDSGGGDSRGGGSWN